MGKVRKTCNTYIQKLTYGTESSQIVATYYTYQNDEFNCFWQSFDGAFQQTGIPPIFEVDPPSKIKGVFCSNDPTGAPLHAPPTSAPDTVVDRTIEVIVMFQGVSVIEGVSVASSFNSTPIPVTGQIIPIGKKHPHCIGREKKV